MSWRREICGSVFSQDNPLPRPLLLLATSHVFEEVPALFSQLFWIASDAPGLACAQVPFDSAICPFTAATRAMQDTKCSPIREKEVAMSLTFTEVFAIQAAIDAYEMKFPEPALAFAGRGLGVAGWRPQT